MIITIHDTQPLPTGEYPARLVELTTVDSRYGEQLRFKFEIVRGEYQGRTLIAFATPSGNPTSKCVRWASALVGRALQAGEQLDLQSLVGRYCLLAVVRKAGDGGREVNVVQEVYPPRRPQPMPAPSSEPVEGDPFE